MSWLREPALGRFLLKRSLRILPGFAVAVLISIVIVGPLGDPDWWSRFPLKTCLAKLAILSLNGLPDSFPGSFFPAVNSPTWTIRFEVVCYLLVAGLGVLGLLRRRGVVLAIAVAALVYHAIEGQKPFPRLTSLYLAGTCFYLYRDQIRYTLGGAVVASLALVAGMYHEPTATVLLPTVAATSCSRSHSLPRRCCTCSADAPISRMGSTFTPADREAPALAMARDGPGGAQPADGPAGIRCGTGKLVRSRAPFPPAQGIRHRPTVADDPLADPPQRAGGVEPAG